MSDYLTKEHKTVQFALAGIGFTSAEQLRQVHAAVENALAAARNDALEEAKQAVIAFGEHQNTIPGEISYERGVAAEDIADIIEALKTETRP